jgi:ribosomal-protein-alanine N-acetyltransferase
VLIRTLTSADAVRVAGYQVRNREYFRASQPSREASWFDVGHQESLLEEQERARAAGTGISFGVFEGDLLVGRVTLSGIVRGPFCNAFLGYTVDRDHTGRGIATYAVRHAVGRAFDEGLHRVQAAVMPDNGASKRVLEKAGFRREGLALRYLELDGVWRDHDLYAVTAEEWPSRAAEGP